MGKKRPNSNPKSAGLDGDEQTVLDYMTRQNRPYSAIDVFNNLHGAVNKSACVKVLTSLAEKELLRQKTYGKQNVFVVRQDTGNASAPEELSGLDCRIEEARKSLQGKSEANAKLQSQLQALISTLTTEKLQESVMVMGSDLSEGIDKLERLKTKGHQVDHKERTRVVGEGERLSRLLSHHRRLCMEIIGGIMEGAGEAVGKKTAREFMEEMGCEFEQ